MQGNGPQTACCTNRSAGGVPEEGARSAVQNPLPEGDVPKAVKALHEAVGVSADMASRLEARLCGVLRIPDPAGMDTAKVDQDSCCKLSKDIISAGEVVKEMVTDRLGDILNRLEL